MTFQDELKSKIKSEEELKKKDIEKAKNKADWDYRAVKDWLLFEAEQGIYTQYNGKKAIQTVYPDTSKFSCEASEYIKIKGEMKELDVGRVFRKIVKQYIVKCCVIDSELYQVYLNELKRLAKEDDVIIDVIARRRFGKEPVEEVAVPGVIKVYQDRFYMENQWNICVKATVIVE